MGEKIPPPEYYIPPIPKVRPSAAPFLQIVMYLLRIYGFYELSQQDFPKAGIALVAAELICLSLAGIEKYVKKSLKNDIDNPMP